MQTTDDDESETTPKHRAKDIFRQEYKNYLKLLNGQYSSVGVMYNGGTLFRRKVVSRLSSEDIDVGEYIPWLMRSFYAYTSHECDEINNFIRGEGIELAREYNHRGFPKDDGSLWTPTEHINGERVTPDGMIGTHPVILSITPVSEDTRQEAKRLADAFAENVYVVYTNGMSEYVTVDIETITPDCVITPDDFPSNKEFDNVLRSLYIVNKQAKKHAESAHSAYQDNYKGLASEHSSRKSRLYSLKSAVLNTIHSFADDIKVHEIDGDAYYCLYFTDFGGNSWSFHTPQDSASFELKRAETVELPSFESESSFDGLKPDDLDFDPVSYLADRFTGTYRFVNRP